MADTVMRASVEARKAANWFEEIWAANEDGVKPGTAGLRVTIDRFDVSMSQSALFAPSVKPSVEIPDEAWIEVRSS